MNRFALPFALFSQVALLAQGASPTIQSELKKLDEDFLKAVLKKDTKLLESLMHPDFWWVSPGGNMVGKSERISSIAGRQNPIDSLVTKERTVSKIGELFRVSGIYEVKGTVGGKSLFASIRFVRIYQKISNRWQLLTEQEVQRGLETIQK
jgi:ketosteroid isomerase-like protein